MKAEVGRTKRFVNRQRVTGLALCAVLIVGASSVWAFQVSTEKAQPSSGKVEPKRALPNDARPDAKIVPATPPDAAPKPIPDGPKPVIKPDEETHDFGTTWVGDTLKHSFKIKNVGEVSLEITKVQPGCGCTLAGQHPSKLEPGEEGEFPFSLNSSKLHGPYEKMITVSSNDPVNPQLKLKLKGEVKQFVSVVPASANFGRVFGGEPQERVLKIANNTDKPLQLTLNPPPADSKFQFTLTETEPGKAFDLKVALTPTNQPGNLNTQVSLQTNVENQKTVDIQAIATIPPRIDIQPAEVTVIDPAGPKGAQPGAPGLTRLVRVQNYGATPVKVLEATCDDPDVQLTIQERTAGKEYTVQVQLPSGYKPPDTGRTITLKTDDSEKPAITIPIKSPVARTADTTPKLSPAEQMVGQDAPSFTLNLADGKKVSKDDLKNTVTVLDFFAPNCGYCKKQMPRIEPIRQQYTQKGVRFLAVAEKMRKDFTKEEIEGILKEAGCNMELALDMENAIGPQFKASSYPTMVLLGKSGKIEAVNSGNIGDLESKLTGQLDALLEGKSLPKPEPAKAAAAPQPERKPATDMIGKPAPQFTLNTLDGKALSNAEFGKYKATILNFFAPNCPHCKKQIPVVEGVRKEFEAKGVRFVNVSETMRKTFTTEEVMDVLKSTGAQMEVATDADNKVGQMFLATGFPTMVVVDGNGKIDNVHVGNSPELDGKLRTQLEALISGKPSSTAASAPTTAARPVDGAPPVKLVPVEPKPIPVEKKP